MRIRCIDHPLLLCAPVLLSLAGALRADGPGAGRGQDVTLGRGSVVNPGFPAPDGSFSTDPSRFPRPDDDFGAAVEIVIAQVSPTASAEVVSFAVGAPGADSGLALPLDPAMGDPSTPDPSAEPPRRGGAVFLFAPGNLFTQRRIGNPNPGARDAAHPRGDRFGASLLQVGDVLFVGAPGGAAPGQTTRGGVVYGFSCDAASGSNFGGLVLTIANPSPGDGDEFGASLGSAGTTLLIGAPGRDVGQEQDVGTVWQYFVGPQLGFIVEVPNPLGPAGGAGSRFGHALAGAEVLVASPQSQPTLADPGLDNTLQLAIPGSQTLLIAAVGAPLAANPADPSAFGAEGGVFVFDVDPSSPPTHGQPIGAPIFASTEHGAFALPEGFGASVKLGQAMEFMMPDGMPGIVVAVGAPGTTVDLTGFVSDPAEQLARRGASFVYILGDSDGGGGGGEPAITSTTVQPQALSLLPQDWSPVALFADPSAHGEDMAFGASLSLASELTGSTRGLVLLSGAPGFTIDDTFDFGTGDAADNLPLAGVFPRTGALHYVGDLGGTGLPPGPTGAPPVSRALAESIDLFGVSGGSPALEPAPRIANPEPDDLDDPSQGPPGSTEGDAFGAATAMSLAGSGEMILSGAPRDDELARPLGGGALAQIADVGSLHVLRLGETNHVPEPKNDCLGDTSFGFLFTSGLALIANDVDQDPQGPPPLDGLSLWRADAFGGRFATPPRDAAGDVVNLDRSVPDGAFTFQTGGQIFGDRLVRYVVRDRGGNYAAAFAVVYVVNEPPSAVDTLVTVSSTASGGALTFTTDGLATDFERDSGFADRVVFEGTAALVQGPGGTVTAIDDTSFFFDPEGASGAFEVGFTVKDLHAASVISVDGTPFDCDPLLEDTTVFADTTVVDESSGLSSGTLLILVNTPPQAGSTTVTIDEDATLTLDLVQEGLVDDPDTQLSGGFAGLAQTIRGATISRGATPPDAQASFETGGSPVDLLPKVVYVAGRDFSGDDTVVYTVTDGVEESAQAQILIHVSPLNDPPLAPDTTVFIEEDGSAFIADTTVTAAIIDPDDAVFDITGASVTSGSGTGAATRTALGTTYDPPADFSGAADVEVEFADRNASGGPEGPLAGVQRVRVVVLPVNDAPFAPTAEAYILEDTALAYDDATAVSSVVDPDDDDFSVTGAALAPGAQGALSRPPSATATTLTPPADFFGDSALDVTISDANDSGAQNGTRTATGRVIVHVLPVNDAPLCSDIELTVAQDSTVSADVTGEVAGTPIVTDVDGDGTGTTFALFLTQIAGEGVTPTAADRVRTPHGVVAFEPGGARFTYAPDPDFAGDDVFTYTVADGLGVAPAVSVAISTQPQPDLAPRSGTGTVTVHVTAASAAPGGAGGGSAKVTGGARLLRLSGCATGAGGALDVAQVLGVALAALGARAVRRGRRAA